MPDNNAGQDQGGRASSLFHRTDLVLTLLIFAVSGLLYYITSGFEEVPVLLSQNIGPEWFPRLLIWTIVVLSLALPIEHLFQKEKSDEIDEDRSKRIKPIAFITAGLLALLVLSITLFGTLVAMFLGCATLPLLWGERRVKFLVPYMILFPTAVALLFTKVLKVYFEPGLWGPVIG